MKKFLFYLISHISYLISHPSLSQTVTVVDKSTLEPLPAVTISTGGGQLGVITNAKGEADISAFKNSDSIFFQHIVYISKTHSYRELQRLNFKVRLSEKSYSLEEVVISASRFEEKKKDVVQPIQVIQSKEIAFSNSATSAEMMQNTGNVFVQKSQMGGGSPVIRGFETNKVLMVVDGVRMNNAIYRGGHLQNIITLDNSIMEKVEIVFGPGSVVYGSDALGGVMHFHTKKPLLSDSSGLKIHANAFTRHSTALDEKTGHADVSLGGQKFGSLTSITYSDFGDMRQGNIRNPFYGNWGKRSFYVKRFGDRDSMLVNDNTSIQKQSGYRQYDFFQKFLLKQNEKITHLVNFQYSTSSDIPRYDRLVLMQGALPRFAEWYYGPQKRLFASYTLTISRDKGIYDHCRIIAGYQNIEESRHDRRFQAKNKNSRMEQLDIGTFNADFDKKIKRHEIRFGTEVTYNRVQSSAFVQNILTGEKFPLDTRYPSGGSTLQSSAVYVTHTFEISPRLILTDGIRNSAVSLRAKFSDTTFFPFPFNEVTQQNNALNGNLGLIVMPGADWRFTLLGSSGFRAPNVDDLSKVFESVPGRVIVPNPNLLPEYTYNADLGISKIFAEQVTVGGTGFYTWYKDAITTKPGLFNGQDSIFYSGYLSQVTMNVNAAAAYIYGVNGYFSADITDYFSVSGTLNYTFGRILTDTTDYPLDHIPPVYGKTNVQVRLKKFKGEFFVLYNGAKLSRDYNLLGEDNQGYSADPINGYMPAWMTLNVRTAYQFNKNIQVQIALENILDHHYRAFASNISGPGRNLVVTLRGGF